MNLLRLSRLGDENTKDLVLLSSSPFKYFGSCRASLVPLAPEAYAFGKYYPEAQHLLFAFDYGHALVYERCF